MGVFDVRCAISGVVIRTGDVVILPLVCAATSTKGHVIGLPIAGRYDGYGKLEGLEKSAALDAFAKALSARATFSDRPPKGAKQLLERLTDLSEPAPTLDAREVGIAYVLKSVYEARVAMGARDANVSVRLRGKKAASEIFDAALQEAALARSLYEGALDKAEKEIRLALVALSRSGLGWMEVVRARDEDREQYGDAQIAETLATAKSRVADAPEMLAALGAYERALDPDDDDDDEHDEVATAADARPVRPALEKWLGDGSRDDGNTQIRLIDNPSKKTVQIEIEVLGPDGQSARSVAAWASQTSSDPERDAQTAIGNFEAHFETRRDELRILAGAPMPASRVHDLLRAATSMDRNANRLFSHQFVASTNVTAFLIELVDAMKTWPYTDDLRAAWIAILKRAKLVRDRDRISRNAHKIALRQRRSAAERPHPIPLPSLRRIARHVQLRKVIRNAKPRPLGEHDASSISMAPPFH